MSDTFDAPASYARTRARLESYFDGSASETWARLTSDAPVSRIRRTVREGRDRMRAALLSALPEDLDGAQVLDAGCGAGQLAAALAERGAQVTAVDIAPSLLEVAAARTPDELRERIRFVAGDMLDPALAPPGGFDFAVAMDSLIHYAPDDIARALTALGARVQGTIAFTVAPRTPLLSMMHAVGKAFPRDDRSPAIAPISPARLARALAAQAQAGRPALALSPIERVARGFYISEAMAARRGSGAGLDGEEEAAR